MFRRAQFVLGLAALVGVAFASASAGQGPPAGSPPGLDKAIAAKQKHADEMLDKPGVAGIAVGLNRAGKPIIRIYKERPDVEGVPESLDDVPVESVTTGVLEPRAPTDRFPRPVPIGVSAGHFEFATGTLGVRVTDGTNVYALSNNHVFAGINSASIGDPILQPGPIEDGGTDPADRIGTLHDYQPINFDPGTTNTMDAAIAATTTALVGTSTPADGYGAPSPVTVQASIGQAVQKYGRTTGLQLGSVAEINATVDVCYSFFVVCWQEARFVNQISVTPGPFSAAGDSGSLIVTQGGNQPVALLFAGGDGLTIGSPIDAVLQRFNVTIDGSAPPVGPPGAPTALSARAGDASVSLSWTAPAFDGGSAVTSYRVYRGTSSGSESFLATSAGTSYNDASAQNGTTYYYKVSAVNANGEGPLSSGANATPIALVQPAALPAPLDAFNRQDENPLSDAGKWSNDIIGGGLESGHWVTSNQLACTKTTTCTAWRNNAQYGPDVEVWARVSTLLGVGNHLRIYARLQQPSAAAAYMLRTNELSGTDEVYLERFTSGSATRILTMSQELAAGDILLLRAKGSTIEAWRQAGGSWSRIGVVQDATHGASGSVGIGVRGTTGRVDDFGARTLGVPPPDTEPPSAPGSLTASATSTSQIDLSWQAASDNVAVTLYRIERCQGAGCSDFAEIGTTASTTFPSTGLTASTEYSYRVRAQDAVPNVGLYSNTASATTQTPPDTEPPSAPGSLTASATSTSQIDLSWQAASDNVAVTLYRIERCQGAGCSDFAEIGTTASTTFPSTGLTASTEYSYRVRAQDAVPNVGLYSNTASATTQSGAVNPVEPLPTLDTFNRRNENPLSDGGRWSNGVSGAAETGLRVVSNTLGCTKTTTCTAWRNSANETYGPDTEVWARVTTLPGTGNQFRLYARLQGVGSSAQTGYVLRTNQLTGTDQVLLERLDGASIMTRLTIAQELTVGDTLLLRVKGATLEAWLKRGSTWSALGSVVDSTYALAGRVGVGIRGKNGRLDDFGAR